MRSWVGTPQETFKVIERVFTGPGQRLNFAAVTFPAGTIAEGSGARTARPLTMDDPAMSPIKQLPPQDQQ